MRRTGWRIGRAFAPIVLLGAAACAGSGGVERSGTPAAASPYRSLQLSPSVRAVAPKAGLIPPNVAVQSPEDLPIDLPTVLRLAGSDALEVRLAAERLAEAKARRLSADFQFLPTIQPGFAARWHDGQTQDVQGKFLDVTKQSSSAGVGASIELRLGESIFQSLAARRRVEANQAGLQAATDDARLRAVNAYFDLVLARADEAIVEDRLKQADETVRLTDRQHQEGAGLLSEVKRAEAARAEVRQRLAASKEKTRIASLNLTEALHIDPLVSLTPRQEAEDVVTLVPAEKTVTDLASEAIERRPELAAGRAFWAALDKDRQSALLGPLIPTVRGEVFDGGLGRVPGDSRESRDAAFGLVWKIGPGGLGDVSRVRIAEAQQRQESLRFAQTADRVVREVVQSLTHVQSSQTQFDLSKEEVAAASESLRLSRERMKNGAALTIEVLSAEEALFSAQSRAAQQAVEINKAQYALLRSIGGLREADLPPVKKP